MLQNKVKEAYSPEARTKTIGFGRISTWRMLAHTASRKSNVKPLVPPPQPTVALILRTKNVKFSEEFSCPKGLYALRSCALCPDNESVSQKRDQVTGRFLYAPCRISDLRILFMASVPLEHYMFGTADTDVGTIRCANCPPSIRADTDIADLRFNPFPCS